MKKKLSFIVAFIATAFFLQNCEKEKKEEVKPPIKIVTVAGPNKTPCGGFDWDVTFTLKDASVKGGYIVQKITRTPDIRFCDNSVKDNTAITFWEAWEIKAGKDLDNERDKGTFTYDDKFREPDHPNLKGTVDVKGELKFFENIALPATFKKNNPDTYAGGLPSTTKEPAFWTNTDAVSHNMNSAWICCDATTTSKIITVPVTEGRDATGVPADTGRLDYTGNLIRQIPAWTTDYDTLKTQKLLNISRQLSYIPVPALRPSIQSFFDVFVNAAHSVDELSKVYLLLRVLYQLPESADRNTVKVFGGFFHPGIDNPSTPFNLSWPVSVSGNAPMFQIKITGKFRGYFGRAYDAVGELDYFNNNFEKRKL